MRAEVALTCIECKQRNYNSMKNKKDNPDRLETHRYHKLCKRHTFHKEIK